MTPELIALLEQALRLRQLGASEKNGAKYDLIQRQQFTREADTIESDICKALASLEDPSQIPCHLQIQK